MFFQLFSSKTLKQAGESFKMLLYLVSEKGGILMKTQRRLHAALAQHRKLKSLAFKICAWETVRDTEVKQHLE